MKRQVLFFLLAALLLASVAQAQQVASADSEMKRDRNELVLRLSQDETYQAYIISGWEYVKVVDKWIASLTPEQQKAREAGELFMPEFYTEAERQQFYTKQAERLNQVVARFPELKELPDQESSWVRKKANDIILKDYKK